MLRTSRAAALCAASLLLAACATTSRAPARNAVAKAPVQHAADPQEPPPPPAEPAAPPDPCAETCAKVLRLTAPETEERAGAGWLADCEAACEAHASAGQLECFDRVRTAADVAACGVE